MKYLLLLLLLGCDSTPPTKAEVKKSAYIKCTNPCESKHLSPVWIKGWKSDFRDPLGLRKCLQLCEKKLK